VKALKHLILTSLAVLTIAGPAAAQTRDAMKAEDKMSSGAMASKTTEAQNRTAKRCMTLSAAAKAKNAACRKLAQSHPDAMVAQDAMSPH
jgi:hypothetical protein